MNLFHEFLKGGIIMWPILILSIIAMAITIEKYWALKKVKKNFDIFMPKLNELVKQNELTAAVNLCKVDKSPAANIFYEGFRKLKFGYERTSEAMEYAGKKEIAVLEKGLSILADIAGAAPMLGFLGTVTGLTGAFQLIEKLQGAVGPGDLAGGIYEALITTIFGLIVGIPVLIVYNQIIEKIKKIVLDIEYHVNEILDMIVERNSNFKK